MNPEPQAGILCRLEDGPGLVDGEVSIVTKNIAIDCQLLSCHPGDHDAYDFAHVVVARLPMLFRKGMSAEESRNHLQSASFTQNGQRLEHFDLVFETQAVPALGFNRRGAVAEKQFEVTLRACDELIDAGTSRLSDAGLDSSSQGRNFLIGLSLGPEFIFESPRSGKNRVCVAINEARHGHQVQTRSIEDLVFSVEVSYRQVPGRTDPGDAAGAAKDGPILDNSQLRHRVANERGRTPLQS